jgi:hypothetical protein
VAILLENIRQTGTNNYDLDFVDEGVRVSFSFVYHPERGRCDGNRAFADHFEGRTSGREAMMALGRFIAGQHVDFPVEVPATGWSNRF